MLAKSLVGIFIKFVGSHRISRFVVAGFPSLFTAAHFHSLPLGFRLLSIWRREAVRFLTKPRNTQARPQSQRQKAKEFSRWLQFDIKRAHRRFQFKKRCNPVSKAGRVQARHRATDCMSQASSRNPEVTEPEASDLEHWMPKPEQQNASSSLGCNESHDHNVPASGERLQSNMKEVEDVMNILSTVYCLR